MAESAGLIVEMIDDQIVVTMSGTLFLAAYRKRQGVAALAAPRQVTVLTLKRPLALQSDASHVRMTAPLPA